MSEVRNNELYHDRESAAQRLGVPIQRVEALIRSGELRSVLFGHRRLVPKQAVDDFLGGDSSASSPPQEARDTSKTEASSEPQDDSTEVGYVPGDDHRYYTPSQVATILGTGVHRVKKMVQGGRLSAANVDKRLWIPVTSVEMLLPESTLREHRANPVEKPYWIPGLHEKGLRGTRDESQGTEEPRPEDPSHDEGWYAGDKEFYSVDEVAEKLGKAPHEVWRMAYSGDLEAVVVGGERMFPREATDAYLYLLAGRKRAATIDDGGATETVRAGGTTQEFHGATVQEAVAAASTALGVDEGRISFEVLDRGSGGLLGVGKRQARIKAKVSELFLKTQKDPPERPGSDEAGETDGEQAAPDEWGYYYTPQQAASLLKKNVAQVNTLVRRGELPAVDVAHHQWISARAVDELVRRKFGARKHKETLMPHRVRVPEEQGSGRVAHGHVREEATRSPGPSEHKENRPGSRGGYYDVEEAAEKLGASVDDVRHMVFLGKLRMELVEGKRLLPRGAVDAWVSSGDETEAPQGGGAAATEEEPVDTPATRGEVAHPAEMPDQKPPAVHRHPGASREPSNPSTPRKTIAERAEEDRRVVMDAAQRLGTSINKVRQLIAKGRLVRDPVGGRLVEPDQVSGPEDTRTKAEKQKFFTVEEAAQYLGEPLMRTMKRVRNKEMPLQGSRIPARFVLDVYYGTKLGRGTKPGGPAGEDAGSPGPTAGESQPDSTPAGGLESTVRSLRDELRAEKAFWEQEIAREREEREQANLNARYEIAQLEVTLENLRREGETSETTLLEDLEEERSRRVESERWAEDLQSELDEERAQRLAAEEAVRPWGTQRHEIEEIEEKLVALRSELQGEREQRLKGEEGVSELRSRLEEVGAEKEALEEALASEREKVRRMEADKRLLDDVRRLLGAGDPQEPTQTAEPAPEKSTEEDGAGVLHELVLETPSGRFSFRPPFKLEDHEAELLRIVAREDEISAEQIRRLKNRRAVEKLNDLLDRLETEGMNPVSEVNDRYSFDPASLQKD